ncbi:MAG: NADH-quinone oxidoreductase subunit L, partial [bacterium]|nr:NADH-quinone oxidoreductase subunit L [bacterium]
LLFIGAMGKSAQFPLHIWLPDAMEGPTPVSALIHAATMVAAGVYMLVRCFPIFEVSETIPLITLIGYITIFISGLMALAQTDIKKILAYSTISQLGLMFTGITDPNSSFFHLITHAFFKAGLFLSAGAIIHALHTNDIFKMGGLAKSMLATTITTFVFYASILGIFPFSGFFSKELIFESYPTNYKIIAFLVIATTTIYMTRMFYYTFGGLPRDINLIENAHDPPKVMLYPLWILMIMSIVSGFLFKDVFDFKIKSLISVIIFQVFAISLAFVYIKYLKSEIKHLVFIKLHALYRVLYNRIYIDDVFIFFIKLFQKLSILLAWFDDKLDMFFVDIWGSITNMIASIIRFTDDQVIDRLVDFWGKFSSSAGKVLRKVQSGFVQSYIFLVVVFFFIVLITLGR